MIMYIANILMKMQTKITTTLLQPFRIISQCGIFFLFCMIACGMMLYQFFLSCRVMTVKTLDYQDHVDCNMMMYLNWEVLHDRAEMLSHVIRWNQMNNRIFIVCSCCVMCNICTLGSWNNICEHWLSFQVLKFDMC